MFVKLTSEWWRLFSASHPRLLHVLATAGASYAGRFSTGLVVLLTIPEARRSLDPELFGVWMMLSALIGFFSFADLGVGNGMLNCVLHARARGDAKRIQRALCAGYFCTLAVGATLLASWLAWVWWSSDPTIVAGHISPRNHAEVLAGLTTFVVLLAINVPASLAQKAQLGSQQGHWIGLTQLAGSLATIVTLPIVLRNDCPLYGLVLATIGSQTAANVIGSLWWSWRSGVFNHLEPRDVVDVSMLADLLRAGALFFALQLAVAFAFQSDAIVITQMLGQEIYGEFAVVQKLFLLLSLLLSSALVGLWPAFGDAIARNEMVWARRALHKSLLFTGLFATFATSGLVLSIGWIESAWLHKPISPAWSLLVLLAIWTVVDALGSVGGAFMNGANLIRPQVVFAIAMAMLAFAGKWLLTPIYGPQGAVLATLVSYCLISVPGQILLIRRLTILRR